MLKAGDIVEIREDAIEIMIREVGDIDIHRKACLGTTDEIDSVGEFRGVIVYDLKKNTYRWTENCLIKRDIPREIMLDFEKEL